MTRANNAAGEAAPQAQSGPHPAQRIIDDALDEKGLRRRVQLKIHGTGYRPREHSYHVGIHLGETRIDALRLE